MSAGKPTITKAQDTKPEPKELSRFQKRRASRALKNKKKEQARKARAARAAASRKSYLDSIGSKGTSSEVKQKTKVVKTTKTKQAAKKTKSKIPMPADKRFALVLGAALLAIVFTAGWYNFGTRDEGQVSSANSDAGVEGVTSGELPPSEPVFALLFPAGSDPATYDVRQTNPPGQEPIYTYLDRVSDDGVIIQVTQQEVPDSFDIIKVATEFQATNIIQIDEMKVYHGRNESDNVQSLIFIKEGLIVSIRSPQNYPDDTWAGYIISLQEP